MSSAKFKISPRVAMPADQTGKSLSQREFVSSAALVQSQAGSRPPKPIRLNLDLDPDLHRQLKMRAVETGVTIAQIVRGLIVRELG